MNMLLKWWLHTQAYQWCPRAVDFVEMKLPQKHFAVKKPQGSRSLYYNYKGFFSEGEQVKAIQDKDVPIPISDTLQRQQKIEN